MVIVVQEMNRNDQAKSFRFVNRLDQVMASRGLRQVELCDKAGINRPILNHYLKHKIDRPAPKFLRAICSALGYDRDAVELAAEHLRDELERAGFRPKDFSIAHGGIQTNLSPRLIALAEAAARSPGWAATIKDLAEMATADARRGYPAGAEVEKTLPIVAETDLSASKFQVDKSSAATYDPPKKTRKRKGSAE